MRTTLGHMAVGLRINPSEGVGRGEKRKAGVLLNKGGFLEVLIIDVCLVNARIKGVPPRNRASPSLIGNAILNKRSLQIEFATLRG